jgi:hypothetical protein
LVLWVSFPSFVTVLACDCDLLDPRSFDGVVQRAGASARMASQAAFHGCAVATAWPREEVAALLPDRLTLAPSRGASTDRHPVVFLFGDQRHGAALYGGVTFPTPVVYEEATLAIPFVRHQDESLWIYVPRMVCSFAPAMWTGNASYGFRKCMGRVRREGPFYRVTDLAGSPWLEAQVEVADRAPGEPDRHRFEALRALFDQPVLGFRSDGRPVRSYWQFDAREARVRPADAIVCVLQPFVEGLRPGEHPDLEAGSFEIEGMVWRLSWPLPVPA